MISENNEKMKKKKRREANRAIKRSSNGKVTILWNWTLTSLGILRKITSAHLQCRRELPSLVSTSSCRLAS
jgi:hypothetical protein